MVQAPTSKTTTITILVLVLQVCGIVSTVVR